MSSRSTDSGTPPAIPGLGYQFRNPGLLGLALTHRSRSSLNNERLEFLGDAVLNFVVADLLYHARPGASEGDLSRLRSRLVREKTLAEIARELELGDHLRMGGGELKSGGYLRDSILSDALEAVVGAVLEDGGFEAARTLVARLVAPRIERLPVGEKLKDPKTRLQELLQGRGLALPDYEIVDERGADHDRQFTVVCRVEGLSGPVRATAGSRRKAEQAAARLVLDRIAGRDA